MINKIKDWIFPNKVKINDLPEACKMQFFFLNAGLTIGMLASLVISIVALSLSTLALIPVFIIAYLSLYFAKIRPFLNNEVIVIKGEIVKIVTPEQWKKKEIIPTRKFITLKIDDNYCELPVEKNFTNSIGETLVIYTNLKNIMQRNKNMFRISDYYFYEIQAY